MNNQFDELTNSMAQSVARRGALKKFGLGLAGMALACFGVASAAKADPKGSPCGCLSDTDCGGTNRCYRGACVPKWCDTSVNACCCHCQGPGSGAVTALPQCASLYSSCFYICGAQLCHK